MKCREVEQDLELFVLGGLAEAREAEIEAHLAACSACWAAAEACRVVVREVRLGRDRPTLRPGFARAVRGAVAAEIGGQRRRALARRMVGALGAAAALVAIGLTVWRGRRPGDGRARGAAPREGAARAVGVVQEKWRYGRARATPASPADWVVVQGASLYVVRQGSGGCWAEAVDRATGRRRWRSECRTSGFLAADEQRVYCLTPGGRDSLGLVALGAADGRELWRCMRGGRDRVRGPCRPLPLRGGRVCWVVGSGVHMLQAATGSRLWARRIEGEGPLSCPVADAHSVYLVTGRGLHCLDLGTGRVRWRKHGEHATACLGRPLLALAGQRVYSVHQRLAKGSELTCIDLPTRGVVWARAVPWTRCVLAASEGVYLRGQRVLALDPRTGSTLWARAATGCGPLTLIGGLVHFVDTRQRGRLVALEPRTGRTAWQLPGIRSCDAFARVGATGYIKTQDGVVHALTLCDLSPALRRR